MPQAGLYAEPPPPTAVKGIVARAPTDDSQGVYVTIPSYSSTDVWGPCVFAQKSYTKPTVGTLCLVVFDEDRIPWVTMWVGQTTAFPDID